MRSEPMARRVLSLDSSDERTMREPARAGRGRVLGLSGAVHARAVAADYVRCCVPAPWRAAGGDKTKRVAGGRVAGPSAASNRASVGARALLRGPSSSLIPGGTVSKLHSSVPAARLKSATRPSKPPHTTTLPARESAVQRKRAGRIIFVTVPPVTMSKTVSACSPAIVSRAAFCEKEMPPWLAGHSR